ncbi:hypothetical protein ACLOJK_033834 [Asimina triloba]
MGVEAYDACDVCIYMIQAICCGEKDVVVSVYVEKPRSSFKPHSSSSYHDGQRHHGRLDGGPNRRANLLRYCQNLRETVTAESAALIPSRRSSSSDASTTTKMKTMATDIRLSSDLSSVARPLPPPAKEHATKIISAGAPRRHSKTPACFGDLGELIPRFMKSLMGLGRRKEKKKKKQKTQHGSASSRMSAVIKSFDVRRT